MSPQPADTPLAHEALQTWNEQGYIVVPNLFSPEEVDALRERFDHLAQAPEESAGRFNPDLASTEPLKRYPRVMHPHRFCDLSLRMMLKPDLGRILEQLMGESPVACQSMYYFKPPQSPGQALHQDNFYLAVQPDTCIAAWTAIDAADPDNGGMYLVPGSHRLDVHCPDPATFDPARTSNLVDPPKGMRAVPAVMQPGDTLFFGGSVIHGSGRNRSNDRWRRAFIGHYMPRNSSHVNRNYFPILDFAGNVIDYESATEGGPCGDALGAIANSYGKDAVLH